MKVTVPRTRRATPTLSGLLVVSGLTLGLTLAAVPAAHAQEAGANATQTEAHRGHARSGDRAERFQARAERRVQRMLDRVEATEQQRAAILPLARESAQAMREAGRQRRELSQQRMTVLSQPVIDRARLEELRRQQVALTEKSSRRMTGLMADMAEQLDPAQRATLLEMMQERGGHRGKGHKMGMRHGGMDPAARFSGRGHHHRAMI